MEIIIEEPSHRPEQLLYFPVKAGKWKCVNTRDFDYDLDKSKEYVKEYIEERDFWRRAHAYYEWRRQAEEARNISIQHYSSLSLPYKVLHALLPRPQSDKQVRITPPF